MTPLDTVRISQIFLGAPLSGCSTGYIYIGSSGRHHNNALLCLAIDSKKSGNSLLQSQQNMSVILGIASYFEFTLFLRPFLASAIIKLMAGHFIAINFPRITTACLSCTMFNNMILISIFFHCLLLQDKPAKQNKPHWESHMKRSTLRVDRP